MEGPKENATEENIENFKKEFEPLFNNYIDTYLENFLKSKRMVDFFEYYNSEFITVKLKLENEKMIGRKMGRERRSDFLVLNIKQVTGYKKGIFKSMIKFIEKICKEKKINLFISQIFNKDLLDMLEKNGYTVFKEEDIDIIEGNAIKIFDNLSDGKKNKSKKLSKKKRKSRKFFDIKKKKSKKRSKKKRRSRKI